MSVQYDVIIIGAGPAGMSAAIYATRAGLKTAMLEKDAPGGKLVKTFEIQNWPGITDINGADLAYKMFEHSTHFGGEYLYGDVINIEEEENYKKVITCDNEYTTHVVIVATGTKERLLNIPGEEKFTGRGVSYCAVCDGAFFKEKNVVVIGGGNSALEEAIYLTQFAKEVTIVIRRDEFRAEPIVQQQIKENPKIKVITKTIPIAIEGDDKVSSITLENLDSKEQYEYQTDAVFPYIGAIPSTIFVHQDVLNENGYMLVNEHMETKIPGLYGAGDVIEKHLRQVVTAANDGAIAGQQAFHYIKSLNVK